MLWRFKSCTRCSGDLVMEEKDWKCIQCGRYYDPIGSDMSNISAQSTPTRSAIHLPRNRRLACGGIPGRSINSLVQARKNSEDKWQEKNKEIIIYLKRGFSSQRIANLMGCNGRRVRLVRQRLDESVTIT